MVSPLSIKRTPATSAAARDALHQHIATLHARIRTGPIDVLIDEGRYHDAVRVAYAAVEDQVRQLAQTPTPTTTMDLIADAFAPDCGSLTDPSASPSRQQAMQRLFIAAFTRHANAVAPYDAGQTLESLMLADLLLGELERITTRLQGPVNRHEHSSAPGNA